MQTSSVRTFPRSRKGQLALIPRVSSYVYLAGGGERETRWLLATVKRCNSEGRIQEAIPMGSYAAEDVSRVNVYTIPPTMAADILEVLPQIEDAEMGWDSPEAAAQEIKAHVIARKAHQSL